MIEGYSVDEAASVLGVPKGRVWELLARGILAGTPDDGGGMRVYLQGRPMEAIVGRPPQGRPAEPGERPAGANGNGGEHGQPGFEASPFRELLTEFRNLTERYGQALLALGEARGEVASLRTRVELLEARVDLRLPSAPPLVQWSPPEQPVPQESEAPRDRMAEPMPEPMADAVADQSQVGGEPEAASDESESSILAASGEEESVSVVDEAPAPTIEAEPTPAEAPAGKTPRPRRRRQSARSATKAFSEALARAQDPTVSQLPGGDETRVAFNELPEPIRREWLASEAAEPTEALEDERADDMVGEIAAPAEEVELDLLVADDELGGGVHEAPAIEPVALEEVEPVRGTGPATPEDSGISLDPVQSAQEAEPAELSQDLQGVEPARIGHEEQAAAAEPVEQTTTAAPAYSHEWDEPDWIAEEDVDWGAGESDSSREPVAMGESPEIGWNELPAAISEAPLEQTEPEEVAEDHGASEPGDPSKSLAVSPDAESARPSVTEASSQAIAVETLGSQSPAGTPVSEPRDAGGDQPPGAGPMSAQGSDEELMYLGDEFRVGPAAWSAPGRATTMPRPMVPIAPKATVSAAEDEALARLAEERGWDDEELHAIRSLLAQPGRPGVDESEMNETRSDAMAPGLPEVPAQKQDTTFRAEDVATQSAEAVEAEAGEEEAFDWEQGPSAWSPPPGARALARESLELPGAIELDQAMAAFEVGAWSKETAAHDDPRPSDEPGPGGHAAPAVQPPIQNTSEPPGAQSERASNTTPQDEADTAGAAGGTLSAPPTARQGAPSVDRAEPSGGNDADWPQGRRGPAANAYRRLRRLFP